MERSYLFVSVPKSAKNAREVKNKIGSLGVVTNFVLPELRIGTLDTLMSLMDELVKHDSFVGGVCAKLAKQLIDFELEAAADEIVDVSKVNLDEVLKVGQAGLGLWMEKFKWNAGRWDYEKSSLHSITEDIVKTASVVDSNLRQRVQDWITINRAMASAKSIATGSVLMRDLAGILKEEHVIDTESLCTLLVVVQKSMLRDWFSSYEALEIEDLKQLMGESGAFGARVVMPKSSVQITEDNDSVLMTCVVLRRFADQIKAKLRERKFMPREFSFDKGAGDNKEKSMEQLANKRLAARQDLLKFAQTQFSEILTCWVHLKAIRVWVESVVRFSLPAAFEVYLIKPDRRYMEKIRLILFDMFRDLVAEGVLEVEKDKDSTPGMPSFVSEELYPYVQAEMTLGKMM